MQPGSAGYKTGRGQRICSGARESVCVCSRPSEKSLATYLDAVPQADLKIETEAFALTRPYFAKTLGHDPDKWQAFADFALTHGLIQNEVDTACLIHTWQ